MSDPLTSLHNARTSAAQTPARAADRPVGAARSIPQAIQQASQATGVDFDYLLAQAKLESGLDADAKARTSSASGLFQFIESTWLETVHRHGSSMGMGDIAARISRSGGRASVADPAMRSAILEMRNDPEAASMMAAALAQDNRMALAPVLGREPEANELYLAHFMGAGGASKFLRAMQDNPDQSAAAIFPRPAAANRPIFYERSGAPRSLGSVMDLLSAKMARAQAGNASANVSASEQAVSAIAASTPSRTSPPTPPRTSAISAAPRLAYEPLPISLSGNGLTDAHHAPAVPAASTGYDAVPISRLIEEGFGIPAARGNAFNDAVSAGGRANDHAKAAYLKFKAFGL